MGLRVSHCLDDTCVRESEPQFCAEMLSSPNQNQFSASFSKPKVVTTVAKTVDSADNSPLVNVNSSKEQSKSKSITFSVEPLNLQLDEVDSPRSMTSNESVLTVISPTKEKRLFSPTKR